MDAAPVFAAILDPERGGRFLLETTFRTAEGSVRVIDSVNQALNGPLPWSELARDI